MYSSHRTQPPNDHIIEHFSGTQSFQRITLAHRGLPQAILQGPILSDQVCLACGSPTCNLQSHESYSYHQRALRARKVLETYGTLRRLPAPSEVTNPRIDPFARYPIPMTKDEHEILDNWARPWGTDTTHGPERHLFPRRHIDVFLPHAMKSPLLMRVALNLIITHTALPRGKITQEAYIQQRKTLEHHLSANNDSSQLNSDGNILAAMNVMSNYSVHGEVDTAFKLMVGIYQMVAMRGGLHQLGMNGQVAAYVTLSDHVYALMLRRKPVFEIPLPSLQFPGLNRRSGDGFERLHRQEMLSKTLLDGALDLCRAFDLFEDGLCGRVQNSQLDAFHYIDAVAEYQLACVLAVSPEVPALSLRETCICLALLILDHMVLRNLGTVAPVVRSLEAKFWEAFTAEDKHSGWKDEDQDLLVWLLLTPLVIGIRGTCTFTEQAINKLRALRNGGESGPLKSLEDFDTTLRTFIYLDVSEASLLLDVWSGISK